MNTKELDFIALGRILVKKYFLYEENVINKKDIEVQYKYCI